MNEGYEVVGVDDLSYGSMANLSPVLDHPKFTFAELDCTRRRALRTAFDGCDAIAHLAAKKIPRFGGVVSTLRGQRGRRQRGVRRGALPRRRPDHHVHLRRVRERRAAVRRGRHARAGPADVEALVVRGLEDVRRAPRARPRGGARPEGDRPSALQRLRAPQPPELVGRPARDVHRGAPGRPPGGDPRRRPPDEDVSTYVTDTVDGFVRRSSVPRPAARS